MNPSILLSSFFLSLLCLFSCQTHTLTLDPLAEDNWVKLVVPEVQTIYSFSGSIDSALIIGGSKDIRKTSDRGTSWSITQDSINVYEFRRTQDTLFAIGGHNTTDKHFFSLDEGDHWIPYIPSSPVNNLSRLVTASDGTMYQIVDPGTYPKEPDQVLKSTDNGDTWVDIFPFQHYLYSIYLDEMDRLYIGAIGWEWEESSQSFTAFENEHGLIYYLKE